MKGTPIFCIFSSHTSTTYGRALLCALMLALFLTTGCDSGVGAMDEGEKPSPTQDQTPPTITITTPVANASIEGTITVETTPTDNVGVAKVEFYLDGTLVETRTAQPWMYEWNTLDSGDGEHTLQAKAYDAAGNQGISSTVSVTAKNGLSLSFRNTTYTPLSINPSGQGARVIAPGATTTFTYDINPGRVTYDASTKGRYGKTVRWSNKAISTEKKTSESVTMQVGGRLFFLRLRNSSNRSTASLYVNYKGSDETKVDPFSLGSAWKDIGYFQGHSQTQIRVYSKFKFGDFSPVWWEWTENVPSQSNYKIQFSLTNNARAAKQADGEALDVQPDLEPLPFAEEQGLIHYGEAGE